MKNKIAKNIVMILVVVSAISAVMSSTIVWHQPKTPNCVA
jgi:cyclic lactone autoinducer peptide